jgi:hypothetical protein
MNCSVCGADRPKVQFRYYYTALKAREDSEHRDGFVITRTQYTDFQQHEIVLCSRCRRKDILMFVAGTVMYLGLLTTTYLKWGADSWAFVGAMASFFVVWILFGALTSNTEWLARQSRARDLPSELRLRLCVFTPEEYEKIRRGDIS